jgi:Uma2 family endonuclease
MIQRIATLSDLYEVEGKAELVDGRIEVMPPTGDEPGYAGGKAYIALDRYAEQTGKGVAYPDGVGFECDLPNRGSFSPDASYYIGPAGGRRFLPRPPVFAIEVRSEDDFGPAMEEKISQKRADYFAAGTLVVWDVDLWSPDVVRVYRATSPDVPTIYRRGELAEAEPAMPGWTFPVDELFRKFSHPAS